ncbi:MAG TPA: phosphatidate cytidylyltransferase [Thermomicrobiales bacterium]|nr:phosphatidate cytidylyltransferase [Thermomicrobiales bacterium]
MRQRAVSSIAIVLIGLIPAILGGPFFALAFTLIAVIAYHELATLLGARQNIAMITGYVLIVLAALLAYARPGDELFPAFVALAVFGPLIVAVFAPDSGNQGDDTYASWVRVSIAALYLGVATFAAISLRQMEGPVDSTWFESLGKGMTFTDRDTATGLGWLLLAILVTWLSDTAAYLVGRSVGRTPLLPRVSPKKTIEGAIGGFIAAGLTALICILAFGIDINPLTGLIVGVLLGGIGMIGDLCESLIKRKAGVKDSGTLIPGHGGVLDRIDALVFVIITTWLLVPFLT